MDTCDWENLSEDPIHKWERHTGAELAEQNKPGPAGDLGNNFWIKFFLQKLIFWKILGDDPNTYFMIASNIDDGGEHPEIAVANLKSPAFKTSQHPLECFAFWFYFSVSTVAIR